MRGFLMKKLLCILISALLITSTLLTAYAADISNTAFATSDEAETELKENYYNGFYYYIDYHSTAKIEKYDGDETDLIIPKTIDGYYVTEIGFAAFENCQNLKSVIIPDSVTSIGDSAFWWCSNLTNIKIPDSVTFIDGWAFGNCSSLTNITIPDKVTSIGDLTFYNCKSLTDISIPDSVTSIGDYAFHDCSSLTNIEIPDSVTSIGNDAFSWCSSLTDISIPNSVTSIGNDAFSCCSSLTDISIPNSVTSIGDYAFSNCGSLTDIAIPDSVTSIGNAAFANCNNLEKVDIDNKNKNYFDVNGIPFSKNTNEMLIYPEHNNSESLSIPSGIVKTCKIYSTTLKTLNIPATVTELGEIKCNCLENINVNEQNPNYRSIDGVLYSKDMTQLITFPLSSSITDLVIPESVTNVNCSFNYSKNLKNISISKNLSYFGLYLTLYGDKIENIFVDEENQAYYGKNGIMFSKSTNELVAYPQNNKTKTFEIPEGTESISSWSYLDNCKYLENVVIPESLTVFFAGGLYKCPNLKNIYVDDKNPEYCDIDGVLYSKDKKTLLLYPIGRKETTYDICKQTDTISDTSFWGNSYLTHITIPNNVKEICYGAFFSCDNLKDFTIQNDAIKLKGIGWSCTSPGGHGVYKKYDDIIIRGYSGTVAEAYAKKYEFSFISLGNGESILGDINGDGVISILDVTEIQKYLSNSSQLNDNQIILADFNIDDTISVVDATEIQKYIANLV